jgi:hypothetical protein
MMWSGGAGWSPRLLIGVAIDGACVRAVGLRFGRVVWGLETEITNPDAIAEALTACLASRPRHRSWLGRIAQAIVARGFPPVATIALGPTHAQTKRLVGLPPLANAHLAARAVQEHAGHFFLKNGIPLVTTSVRADGTESAWAAAFEQPMVTALATACHESRVQLHAIVPAVDVLSHGLVATYDETLVWRDGSARDAFAITWHGGRLAGVRRAMVPTGETVSPVAVPALAVLGDRAWRFAPAYGAAVSPTGQDPSAPLTYRAHGHHRRATSQRHVAFAAAAMILALTLAALAPGLAARRAEQRATMQLKRLGPSETRALSVARELGLVTAALGEVAAFEQSASISILELRDLSNALPTGAALLTVHMDSLGGSIVAIAPRAGAVVTPLDHISWLASPEIVGPVTREHAGGHDVERVTVRFRWSHRP